MDQLNLWLGLLFSVTLAAIIMPSVIAMNHGRILRNVALWLGIFLALALIYKNFGPFGTVSATLPPTVESAQEDESPRAPQDHIELGK